LLSLSATLLNIAMYSDDSENVKFWANDAWNEWGTSAIK
jgi:hypothetical protein